jgi:transposase
MELHTIGIDLGKTVFHLIGLDLQGAVVVRKKFSRKQLLHFTANLQVNLIGMEACGGSHFLGRALREQGHEVRLIPAQLCEALREDQQERLHRCGSNRRGGGTADDALCANQE